MQYIFQRVILLINSLNHETITIKFDKIKQVKVEEIMTQAYSDWEQYKQDGESEDDELLNEKYKYLKYVDPLTGLQNKKSMMK